MDAENAVIRVYSRTNKIVGCGFLAGPGRVLPCAHVIQAALNLPVTPREKPTESILLDFPLVQAGLKISARVVVWDVSLDIAGLELLEPLPEHAQPAPLVYGSRLWGHPFQAFGFPQGYDLGVWADGAIRGPNAAGWIQIDDPKQTGYFVKPGFSGGPVWDEKLQGIVGMVVQADRDPDVRSAFMIPMNLLFQFWPVLPEPTGILGALYEVPAPPENYLPRPDDFNVIKELLLGRAEQATAILGKSHSVGLHGMGGIGKSVLAAVVAQEPEIRRAFPDGLIWLTLGQEPDLTARQEDLANALGEKESFRDKWQGRTRLRELLANKSCLVILDDVWDYRHVMDAFDCLGPDCRLLLTTRIRDIVVSLKAESFTVELLNENQSLTLLAEWSGQPADRLPGEARQIAKECGYLPLALAMVGAVVRRNPESWGKALFRLQHADLDKIEQDFPNYPYKDLLKAIQVSIDALPEGWRERYLDFAVFPEDALIPPAVLHTFWKPADLSAYDVEDVLEGLVNRSLARRDAQGRLFLHDLQRDYVRKATRDLAGLHRRLLDAYRAACPNWSNAPQDGYWCEHLIYHLVQAQEWQETKETLSDFAFLEARCRQSSVYDLQSDYRLALKEWGGEPKDREWISQFEERVRLEASSIHAEPSLLFSALYNHLTWLDAPDGALHRHCEAAKARHKNWLRSLQDPRPQPPTWLQALEGHTGPVNALALTPDGRQVVSGSDDKTIKVWDLESGRLLRSMKGHTDSVNALALTPDGRQIVSGSDDNTIKVWNLETGRLLRTIEGHTGSVNTLALTPDGRQVVSSSSDRKIKVWDLESGRLVRAIERHAEGALVLTPDGRQVVAAGFYGKINVWDLESGSQLRSLEDYVNQVKTLALSPDGRQVVSNAWEFIKVWDLEGGSLLLTLKGHNEAVVALAITPDGRHLVSGSNDQTIKVWNLENGNLLYTTNDYRSVGPGLDGFIYGLKERVFSGHTGNVRALALTPDGRKIVSGAADNTIKVWDFKTGQLLKTLKGHSSYVNTLVLTQDGRQVASGMDDNTIKIWDLENGQLLRSMEGHTHSVKALALTQDGRHVVSGANDNMIKVWKFENGQPLHSLVGHTRSVMAVALTPDGRQIISGSADQTIKVWDLESGRLLRSLEGHTSGVNALALTPDGRLVVSGSYDATIMIWEVHSGQLLVSLKGHTGGVLSLALTPDGRQVISGSADSTIKVWDLENACLIRSLEGHTGGVLSLALTPDGRQIISGSYDNTIKVWDLENGQMQCSLEGHMEPVSALALTQDGRKLVSGAWDKTIKLWDLESGQMLTPLPLHTDSVNTLAITPDERQVISGSDDNTIKVWNLGKELALTFRGHTRKVATLALSLDGSQVISGSNDGTIKVWDIKSGRQTNSFEGHTGPVGAVALTSNGQQVLSGAWDMMIKIWDLQNGRLVHSFTSQHGEVKTMMLTPDGRQVISGAHDHVITMWDPETGQILRTLKGHSGSVNTLALTPNGRQLISGSNDNTIKVWDLASGSLLRSFEGHADSVTALAMSAEGHSLFSSSADKTIRLWDLASGSSQILFWNDSPINCLALSKDDCYVAAGDSAGRVWIFEWIQTFSIL